MQNAETVKDIIQEVFVKLWVKREQLNIQTSTAAYLKRMAVNESISYLRKNKKVQLESLDGSVRAVPSAQSGDQSVLQNELKQKVKEAIDQLPPRCKQVFLLSRYEQFSYKEIGECMGISIKTVENQMGKALKIMREELKEYL